MALIKKGLDKSNTRGLAYFNHGRWLADCPTCGSPIMVDPERGEAVCGACNPGIFAIAYTRTKTPLGVEILRPIADEEMRGKAHSAATPFKFVVPDDWKKLVAELRLRPLHLMNWLPGETLKDIVAENIQHGVRRVK